jgi:uncharacterized protein YegL
MMFPTATRTVIRSTLVSCRLLVLILIQALVLNLGSFPAHAGSSWFSKAHRDPGSRAGPEALFADNALTVFDVVISLHNDPAGDDDPDNDTGSEAQTPYEKITRFWADSICEESNAAHKLGKVRIFRNGRESSRADVIWNASEWPRANIAGFGVDGLRIIFGDEFPNGCGGGCDKNMLADPEGAGYTLGHEWGHYIYALYDEYRGSNPAETKIYFPQTGDTPVSPSIMNSQWNARGGNFEWLNHSTSDNYQANTAQGRVYGKSGWSVLIDDTANDPRDGERANLPTRTRYSALDGQEPTDSDGWVKEELPASLNICRSELEIIWMQKDLELQVVIDRSGSMGGSPMTNAKQAAKNLVEIVPDGQTALGVVSFASSVSQDQAITPIPDPGGTVKASIKAVIDAISATGLTAMFDAAALALQNLQVYSTANATQASQAVFLLTDGIDNDSSATQASVTAAYQSADVPLVTFGYGSFAPTGVLLEMANDTGGLFFSTPTTLAEIQAAFLAAAAAVSPSTNVIASSSAVPANGSSTTIFLVDSTLEELIVLANYVGAPGEVDFAVLSPGGPLSGVTFDCRAVSSSTSCSALIDAATVSAEGPGTWSVGATNNVAAVREVNIDIVATPREGRTFDVTVASLGGNPVTYPEPILVTATASQGLPIAGLDVHGWITDPLGNTSSFSLLDTGENGDGFADDGVYSAILDYEMDGPHIIRVDVDNAALEARFSLEGLQPGHPSPNLDGETPIPPTLPPISETFMRTASVQVNIQGVVQDDHPDVAPGTPISADNSDISGRIDFSGDVDVFTVDTAGSGENLNFRVTDLALGMDSRLTILAADGTTILASANLASLPVDSEYVTLTIPTAGQAFLHAAVEHDGLGTGVYNISVGEPVVTDVAAPRLSCVGFEPPMNQAWLPPAMGGGVIARRVKKNRVFPFKATLVDTDGNIVDLMTPPKLVVILDGPLTDSFDITDESFTNGKRTDGDYFLLAGNKWMHNLASRGFSLTGTYTGTMVSGDPTEYVIDNPTCKAFFVIGN